MAKYEKQEVVDMVAILRGDDELSLYEMRDAAAMIEHFVWLSDNKNSALIDAMAEVERLRTAQSPLPPP